MNEPLLESITALGQLAMRETGAAAYGLYRQSGESGTLVCLQACGARIFEFGLSPELGSTVCYMARVEGSDPYVLTFVFRGERIHEEAVQCLERVIQVVEGVLALALWPKRYAALAVQTAEMEAQLAVTKIRDRARGLIRGQFRGASETLGEFSRTVLRRTETANILERLAVERREEVRERSLTAQAKAVLESVYGMSEEQAHHHLRVMSRKNRRPMKEVALELIGKRS